MQGIYSITNLCNGKKYIGSSGRVKARFAEHRCHFCRCLKEPHRTTGGYKFKYKETA